jgi:hypothetical protein
MALVTGGAAGFCQHGSDRLATGLWQPEQLVSRTSEPWLLARDLPKKSRAGIGVNGHFQHISGMVLGQNRLFCRWFSETANNKFYVKGFNE